jgi:hypothetical protein
MEAILLNVDGRSGRGWEERVQKEGLAPYLGPIGFTLLALKPTNYNFFMGSSWSKR